MKTIFEFMSTPLCLSILALLTVVIQLITALLKADKKVYQSVWSALTRPLFWGILASTACITQMAIICFVIEPTGNNMLLALLLYSLSVFIMANSLSRRQLILYVATMAVGIYLACASERLKDTTRTYDLLHKVVDAMKGNAGSATPAARP